jgi:hypothetical protein
MLEMPRMIQEWKQVCCYCQQGGKENANLGPEGAWSWVEEVAEIIEGLMRGYTEGVGVGVYDCNLARLHRKALT